jgi:hypothetical protein
VIHDSHGAACICDAEIAPDQTLRLDDIKDLMLMHVGFCLEPATSAQGVFAFAASIREGHTLAASGTDLCFAMFFEFMGDTPQLDHGLLVTSLMLELA